VAVFGSAEPVVAKHVEEVERAAKASGINTYILQLQRADEIGQRLAQLRKWNADAIYVIQSSTNFNNRKLLVELSATARLPAMFPYSESAEAGGLMSYGTDFDELYRRAADYVSRILKGAKPADLPVEQPTRFEFVINLRTARALELKISPTVLARADKVIE
jgi:putative ABC transport system substrate-binding protein